MCTFVHISQPLSKLLVLSNLIKRVAMFLRVTLKPNALQEVKICLKARKRKLQVWNSIDNCKELRK